LALLIFCRNMTDWLAFDDGWGNDNSWQSQPAPEQQPIAQYEEPVPVQSLPVQSLPVQSLPVQSLPVQSQPVQAVEAAPVPQQTMAPPQQQMMNNFGFEDEWGSFSQPQTSFAQPEVNTFSQADVTPFQSEPVSYKQSPQQSFQKPMEPSPKQMPVEEPVVEEPPAPEPEQNDFVGHQKLLGSSKVKKWGSQNTDWVGKQAPVKQQPKRRKPPMTKQPVPQQKLEVKSLEPAEPAPEKAPMSSDVPALMERIATLEDRLARLETNSNLSMAICTLNSKGETKNGKITWHGSTNHILWPENGFELSPDFCSLLLKHTGYYEIMVNSYGQDPSLVINGDLFANCHTSKNVSGHFGINVYLEQNTAIEVHVRRSESGNACDHWLSVRRLAVPTY